MSIIVYKKRYWKKDRNIATVFGVRESKESYKRNSPLRSTLYVLNSVENFHSPSFLKFCLFQSEEVD